MFVFALNTTENVKKKTTKGDTNFYGIKYLLDFWTFQVTFF